MDEKAEFVMQNLRLHLVCWDILTTHTEGVQSCDFNDCEAEKKLRV